MSGSFEWPVRVYMEDTDAGGIVYYVNYLKFFERARTELFRSLGYGKAAMFDSKLMFVVTSTNCDYLQPARLDDELAVTAKVIEAARTYVVMEQHIFRTQGSDNAERELLAKASVKFACVDRQSVRPKRIPEAMRKNLTSTT